MNKCVQPLAKIVPCIVCGRLCFTCEKEIEPNFFSCPAPGHGNSCELDDRNWTCSEYCWNIYTSSEEEIEDLKDF